jgi:membrane protein DedA with SNARE-associated domain
VQHFIVTYGYAAVFLLTLVSSACIPIPSEFVMLLGGALAAGAVAGAHLNLVLIIVIGVLGNIVGSYIAWGVGLYVGQAAVRRWGRRIGVREHEIDRAIRWFERRGPAAVLIGRVVPVVRTFISLPAGFAAMRPVRFGVYTTIGSIPWTAGLGIAGYYVGKNWQGVANDFHSLTYVIAALIVIAIVVALALYFRGRRGAGAHASREGDAGAHASREDDRGRDQQATTYRPAPPQDQQYRY